MICAFLLDHLILPFYREIRVVVLGPKILMLIC